MGLENALASVEVNSASSLVLMVGIVPHCWYQQEKCYSLVEYLGEEWCPIIDVCGRNGTPSLVSVDEMVPQGPDTGK